MIDVVACVSGDWFKCGITVGTFLFSLHTWNEGQTVNVLGYQCTPSLKGRIHKFKWVWDGRFRCPFGQEGNSRSYKSRTGAIDAAIRDFFAKNTNLISTMNSGQTSI
jgi:hypothetical protein